jgi:hypothetical protein
LLTAPLETILKPSHTHPPNKTKQKPDNSNNSTRLQRLERIVRSAIIFGLETKGKY